MVVGNNVNGGDGGLVYDKLNLGFGTLGCHANCCQCCQTHTTQQGLYAVNMVCAFLLVHMKWDL